MHAMQSDRIGSPGAYNREPSNLPVEKRPVSLRPISALNPSGEMELAPGPASIPSPSIKRGWSWFRITRWVTSLFLLVALGAAIAWGVVRVRAALSTYHAVTADIQGLQGLESSNFATFTPDDADKVHTQFVQLQSDVDELATLTHLPHRIDNLVSGLPYIGPRYVAGTQ